MPRILEILVRVSRVKRGLSPAKRIIINNIIMNEARVVEQLNATRDAIKDLLWNWCLSRVVKGFIRLMDEYRPDPLCFTTNGTDVFA